MKNLTFILVLLLMSLGCAYKIDVQQGNVLTKETLDTITVGMDRRQVMSLAGAPLIVDAFHDNRWEYVYHMKFGNTRVRQFSYVTMFFEGNTLSEIKIHVKPLPEDELLTPELVKRGRS